MSKDNAIQFRLNNVRISFPQLWEAYAPPPKPNEAPSKPAFQCHWILPPDHPDFVGLKAAIGTVADNQWGANGQAVLKQLVEAHRVCLHNGNTKTTGEGEVLDGYKDMYYISARSYTRPTVIGHDRAPLTASDGKPYSGCYVNGIFRIWPQFGQYGKRINAQLMGVQFFKDGESFGGGRAADPEEFDTLSEFAAGEEDSGLADLIGGEDDIAF